MNSNPTNSGGDQSSNTTGPLTPEQINEKVDYGVSTLFRFSMVSPPELKPVTQGSGTITPPVAVSGSAGPVTPTAAVTALAAGLSSLEAVRDLNSGLFSFGDWLSSNKGDLVFADVSTRLQGVEALSADAEEALWIKTFELLSAKDSIGLTDAVVNTIRASNFKREFETLNSETTPVSDFIDAEQKEFFEEVAAAPLIIPKEQLPVITADVIKKPATYLEPRQQDLLKRAQTVAVAGYRIQFIKDHLTQFRLAEMGYAAERKAAYEKYLAGYQAVTDPIRKAYDELTANICPEKVPAAPELPAYPAFSFPVFDTNYLAERPCYKSLQQQLVRFQESTKFCGSLKLLRPFAEQEISKLEAVIRKNSDIIVPKVLKYGEFKIMSNNGPLQNSYSVQLDRLSPDHDNYSLVLTHFSSNGTEKLAKIKSIRADGTTEGNFEEVSDNNGYKTVAFFINSIDRQENSFNADFEAIAENGTPLFRFRDMVETGISYYGPRPEASHAYQAMFMDGEPGVEGKPMYGIRKIGILDYLRVEQEVCCYVPGEVSRIENIMAREFRKKLVRDLERTEITTEESEESENETSTDTTSTDRYEMHKEISQMIAKEQSNQIAVTAGLNATYDVKPAVINVTAGTSLNFSNSSSSTQGFNVAESIAKEVTQKATERILKKVSYKRTAKMLREHEETNEHGFDNRASGDHVTGIYRWVDKIYKNTVFNYGKRLQYEFMLPEPARNFKLWMEKNDGAGNPPFTPEKPVHPNDLKNDGTDFVASYLTRDNYAKFAAVYGADVEDCPASFLRISKSFSDNPTGKFPDWDEPRGSFKYEIEIPDGYYCNDFWGVYNHSLGHKGKGKYEPESDIIVDTSHFHIKSTHYDWKLLFHGADGVNTQIGNDNAGMYVTKLLPIGISTFNVGGFSLNIVSNCELSADALTQWQQKAYIAIMDAYNKKYQAYLDALVANPEPAPFKPDYNYNPGKGRAIEARELKRLIIENITTGLGVAAPYSMNAYLPVGSQSNIVRYKMNLDAQFGQYAHYVNFLEKAFEWNLISYQFLQYMYAESSRWGQLIKESAPSDPLFEAFLQSGLAKVILTVTPGFEKQVLFFLDTGIVPVNDAFVPTGQQGIYTSLTRSLKVYDKRPVGKPWETRVPTDLIILQADAAPLQQMGLPCVCKNGLANEGLGIGASEMSGIYSDTPVATDVKIVTALSALIAQILKLRLNNDNPASGTTTPASVVNTFKFKKHANLTSADINKLLMNDGDGLAKVYSWSPSVPSVKGQWKISLSDLSEWNGVNLQFRIGNQQYFYSQSQWEAAATEPVSSISEELALLQSFLTAQVELQHLSFTLTGSVLLVDEQIVKLTEIKSGGMPSSSITEAVKSAEELPAAPTAFVLGKLVAIDGDYAVISNEPIETYKVEAGKTVVIDNGLFNSANPVNINSISDVESFLKHIIVPGVNGFAQSLERSWTEMKEGKYRHLRDQLLGIAIASENDTVTVVKVPFASLVGHVVNKIMLDGSIHNL